MIRWYKPADRETSLACVSAQDVASLAASPPTSAPAASPLAPLKGTTDGAASAPLKGTTDGAASEIQAEAPETAPLEKVHSSLRSSLPPHARRRRRALPTPLAPTRAASAPTRAGLRVRARARV